MIRLLQLVQLAQHSPGSQAQAIIHAMTGEIPTAITEAPSKEGPAVTESNGGLIKSAACSRLRKIIWSMLTGDIDRENCSFLLVNVN